MSHEWNLITNLRNVLRNLQNQVRKTLNQNKKQDSVVQTEQNTFEVNACIVRFINQRKLLNRSSICASIAHNKIWIFMRLSPGVITVTNRRVRACDFNWLARENFALLHLGVHARLNNSD